MTDRIIVLNGGGIEQIGTPLEIYNTPASTFVASFMEAPPMNLIPATMTASGSNLADGTIVSLNMQQAAPADLLLGVRPEDVVVGPERDFRFDVAIVEELGTQRLLHGQIGARHFLQPCPKICPHISAKCASL